MRRPRYTLITGDYYIYYQDLPRNGPQPDGDTISFLPDDDQLVQRLPRFNGIAPDRKHLGTYSIRFEGVDALETHFENQHQNEKYARAARDRMLELVGFTKVEYWKDKPNNVRLAEPHPVPGYVLANGIESNGRVLGLVYTGKPRGKGDDGDPVFVDADVLDKSVNAALLREGLTYAELYSTMPLKLIERMRALIGKARDGGKGMWPHENLTTSASVHPHNMTDLAKLVMFPKLYRRLVTYFKAGNADLAGFDSWIRVDPKRDDAALLPTGEMGNLHDLYKIGGDEIMLNYNPEELMFT
jgi:endonuclease YncB( thermonuclease family)